MSKKILDFSTISGESVKKYEGIKKYIATGDITNNKISSYTEVDYSNKPSRANQIAKIGEVLFAKMKDTIKVITINNKNSEYIYSTGFYIIKPKENVLTDYLYWLFNSPKFNIDKDKYCKGATQKALNNEGLSKIEIKELPNIEIQEKIVCKLNKVAEILNKKQEQLNALDELIKSQFVEMFGDPNKNEKNFKTEELKNCILDIENGKSFVCENFARKNEYPAILKLSAVTYGNYNQDENKALIKQEMFISKNEVHSGDLLFTRKNTPELVGMSAFVYDTKPNLMLPDIIFRINTLENCNKIYLWQMINHPFFRNKIMAISNGSAKSMSNISKENLMNLKIILPPIELQNQFAEIVKQIDKQKFEIENSLKEMQELYESLMEKYFG